MGKEAKQVKQKSGIVLGLNAGHVRGFRFVVIQARAESVVQAGFMERDHLDDDNDGENDNDTRGYASGTKWR